MRGERVVVAGGVKHVVGSSPHARGTPGGGRRNRTLNRFIPACAGNAFLCALSANKRAVHPRMRGERGDRSFRVVRDAGSSPHARGTPLGELLHHFGNRFIPACAGNALHSGSGARSKSVHPRMRGERQVGERGPLIHDGSSPHARGTPWKTPRIRSISSVHPRMRGERSGTDFDAALALG